MVDDQRIEDLLTVGVAADTFVIHDLIAEVRELRASVEIAGQELAALKLERDDQHAGYMQINALYQAELKKVADCHDVLKAQKQGLDALQRFKDFVHRRLDTAGVPTHPDGPHSKEGCRIGDRLDLVVGE